MSQLPRITDVDCSSSSFRRSFKRLPIEIQTQAIENISRLPRQEVVPAKLHFHKLNGRGDIWTIHISSCSTYKASFEIENGVAKFRCAGVHDYLDRHP